MLREADELRSASNRTRSEQIGDSAVSFECDFRLSGKLRDDPARILVGSLGGGSKWRRYLDAFSPFASPGHCLTVESRG
jgi:hypothetical protein